MADTQSGEEPVNAPFWMHPSGETFERRGGGSLDRRSTSRWADWIAILSRRGARVSLIAAAGLSLLLLAALAGWWLRSQRASEAPLLDLVELSELQRLQAYPAGVGGAAPPPLVGAAAAQHNAVAPFASLGPPAKPFRFAGGLQDRARARACLAAAMFYEAGDDAIGQLAVGQVVLNRTRHPAFPAAVCGVVAQGSERATGCQFTFTCDGALARPVGTAARARALVHADLMLEGLVFAGVGLATHYHTDAVYPWWSPKLDKIAQVGTHLFFRWPGHWGSARAVLARRAAAEPPAALFARFAGDDAATGVQSLDDRGNAQVSATALASTRPGGLTDEVSTTQILPSHTKADIPLSRRLTTPLAETSGTPVIGEGVLAGNRLLRMFPQDGVFFMQLAEGASDSARRRVAEMLCGGRTTCRVYGWNNAAQAPGGSELDANARRSLAFTYVRRAIVGQRASPSAAGAM
jgi:hypothetical protein